jgi:hypothetical protein
MDTTIYSGVEGLHVLCDTKWKLIVVKDDPILLFNLRMTFGNSTIWPRSILSV